ncbi:MAG: hypothetical protein ACXVII_36510 [Solirubrobacteraceae bacterium]
MEDVWALPVHGGAEDFQTLLEVMASGDPANAESLATRVLSRVRWRLGTWFGWDDAAGELPIPGTNETSLTDRLPDDLRNTAADLGRQMGLRACSPSCGPTRAVRSALPATRGLT